MTDATDAKLVERARDLVAWMDAHNHYPHQYTEPDCWEKAILRFAQSYAEEMVKKEREASAAARKLLDLLLEEEWWTWGDGEFGELFVAAGLADFTEYTQEMADQELVDDADAGDMVYLLKPEYRQRGGGEK